MIAYLTGDVLTIDLKSITLMTSGGVGYQVFVTGSLLSKAVIGESLAVSIFTQVREQEISLYGFAEKNEKQLFEKLLNISGIGPKMAIQIVSQPVDQFSDAVERGDTDFLTKTPGVGKKMAQKIIVELKGKLDLTESLDSNMAVVSVAMNEAIEALEGLGYKKPVIESVLKKADLRLSTEDLIKFFLSSGA